MTGSHDPKPTHAPARPRTAATAATMLVLAPLLAVSLGACTPAGGAGAGHPGQPSGENGGSSPTETQTPPTPDDGKTPEQGSGEGSWGGSGQDDDPAKNIQLPRGFPNEDFVLPKGATIDDTGEREPGNWFVVLRAADAAQAELWWKRIIRKNGFTATSSERTDDGGRSATLRSAALTVDALTIVQDDGSVLLNYDLGPNVG